jgi:hypothetical protein
MKLSKIFAAGLVAFAASAAVAAPTPYTLGDEVVAIVPVGTFADYSFSIVEGDLFIQNLTFTSTVSLSLFKAPDLSSALTPSYTDSFFTYTAYSFNGLSAGDYIARITNTGNTFGSVGFKATVTPVPEAGSIAMAVAGLGVVGLIAARRRKA